MKNHQPDYFFVSAIFALVIFGLVALASASAVISQENFGESYYYLKHQIIYGLSIGVIGFFICQRINYQFWKKIAWPLLILSLILLAGVFLPGMGYEGNEARRWITVGPISLQPFEFVKLAFILYFSAILSRKGEVKKNIKESLIPFVAVFGIISALVLLQPNMSAFFMILLIAGVIYFLAELSPAYLLSVGVLAISGFFVLIKTAAYRIKRLTVYLHPEMDPQGIGYQINQALLAIGSGGLFGLGLGHSIQKWKYLPEVIGDSIFAIIAEEFGFIGAGFLVFLFIFLTWRGLRIAKNAPDKFGYLVAAGIIGWLFFQAFTNIASICRIIPLTGMPLPFVSYGGTALAVALAAAGIVVNISKQTK
ncbi:MAG: putative lipid II flippase FtsW [Candidatus Portnoybacteria bacterium CG_4_10_14_0_2_um_filter_43_36]|uniref:Probable peptidoglycan glycosyltransferase FtsW n=3 Tax=Candidatus Portnoyibacteriota TaxID=1817913 RepID=A0A2M7YKP2_9BACT|nr:MAG: putative lipid II flippase FtsW [Candidatus Portnoybacteria bacterium CG_4_10_14_0_2_um_filter_43_36]PJA63543.1 MAG: putative lipid II flippase FtsW [Candidatus Portnoybacteria bacterium CG_4_9_14_3_um_filter_43_11]PJE59277.1 MAG: putative lipid II flippase FtsW [Candidatus Portnoybacteria bacterium CG10_big_fil_rev_8_21_14_0_10_43_39]